MDKAIQYPTQFNVQSPHLKNSFSKPDLQVAMNNHRRPIILNLNEHLLLNLHLLYTQGASHTSLYEVHYRTRPKMLYALEKKKQLH